jgi:hypothetical protein
MQSQLHLNVFLSDNVDTGGHHDSMDFCVQVNARRKHLKLENENFIAILLCTKSKITEIRMSKEANASNFSDRWK